MKEGSYRPSEVLTHDKDLRNAKSFYYYWPQLSASKYLFLPISHGMIRGENMAPSRMNRQYL